MFRVKFPYFLYNPALDNDILPFKWPNVHANNAYHLFSPGLQLFAHCIQLLSCCSQLFMYVGCHGGRAVWPRPSRACYFNFTACHR